MSTKICRGLSSPTVSEGLTLDPNLPLEDRIVAAIRQIIRAVDLHSRRLMEEYGLTGPQLAVLQEAQRLGPVSSGGLAGAVHLSHPTATGILTRLEKRGLVTRLRGEQDRRTVTISLTPAGRSVLKAAPSLLQDRFRTELARLEEWERLMALTVLQRVASMMGAESLDAAPHLATGSAIGLVDPLPEPSGSLPERQPEPEPAPSHPKRTRRLRRPPSPRRAGPG